MSKFVPEVCHYCLKCSICHGQNKDCILYGHNMSWQEMRKKGVKHKWVPGICNDVKKCGHGLAWWVEYKKHLKCWPVLNNGPT